nr:abortive infection system antitoxin AbiGi family protein [Metabacillus sp. B2-18]
MYKYEKRNFHDEREWRFIPDFNNIETDLPMVIDQEQMNPKSYNAYSQGISRRPELWLKFDFDAIKYIIVSDQSDRKELIEFLIENQIGESEHDRYILLSKILVFNELGEDW